MKTGASLEPVGFDRTTRHNPRASMSTRFIRGRLREIPHYRASARGKIWIDWIDFESWVRKLRVEIMQDVPVVEILRDLAGKRSGAP